jgi:transmembrane sensor
MNDLQVAQWLQLYFNGSISPEQKEQLAAWIQEHGHTEQFELLMQQSWQQYQPGQAVDDEKAGEWLQNVLRHSTVELAIPMKTRSRVWMRWAAAAVIIIIAGLGILFMLQPNKKPAEQPVAVQHDVPAPASSKAVLTLANGERITLDSAGNGALAMQGATNVVKLEDGKIAYQGNENAGSTQFNTLTVPAGSRITGITLSDGTTVTLNAASSITYPVVFNSTVRKVKISGEVYFEVSKRKVPFIVDVNGKTEVEVLGTHFNVKAYDEEESIKTTLLEGKVKVSKTILEPGQQAVITNDAQISVRNDIDLDAVMSWKNGMFLYKGIDIKTIMREVARTYNVKINYESVSTEKFYAEVSRNTNISSLLKMLELTGEVHFKVRDNQVTVMK